MKTSISFRRVWAMPNAETFSIPPIFDFVCEHMGPTIVSADPFARNCTWATYTNDLNPETSAQSHVDAEEFLRGLAGKRLDLVLLDPPYSPRQISECYKAAGKTCGMKETQNAALYKRVKDAAAPLVKMGGYVLSFGWNSSGMGIERGYEIQEILLVCHGGAHNDTICLAEKRVGKMRQTELTAT